MLKKNKPSEVRKIGGHYAIVASKYNARYVDAMLDAAKLCLEEAGAESIRVIRVPGAYEIPVVAARLARDSARVWSDKRRLRRSDSNTLPTSQLKMSGATIWSSGRRLASMASDAALA